MPKVKVIGAAGYAGSELARLLIAHPEIESLQLIDKQVQEPTPIWSFRPNLRSITDQEILPADDGSPADVVFFATPDGVAMKLARQYLDKGAKVIDFSGDTRLRDPEVHRKWYGMDHTDLELQKEAVYGLPELHREEIRSARVVANPGCYATSVTLALAPLFKNGLVGPDSVVADCKSGVSGAGNHLMPRLHFPECHANFSAYKVTGHKHVPEIEQELSIVGNAEVRISFVPHLLPVGRGILSTIYGRLSRNLSADEIRERYETFYETHPFVRVLPSGEECSLKAVQGSNFCDLAVHLDDRVGRVILTSALDNLVKGASGQAVQNMNLVLGLEETTGLMQAGLWL